MLCGSCCRGLAPNHTLFSQHRDMGSLLHLQDRGMGQKDRHQCHQSLKIIRESHAHDDKGTRLKAGAWQWFTVPLCGSDSTSWIHSKNNITQLTNNPHASEQASCHPAESHWWSYPSTPPRQCQRMIFTWSNLRSLWAGKLFYPVCLKTVINCLLIKEWHRATDQKPRQRSTWRTPLKQKILWNLYIYI